MGYVEVAEGESPTEIVARWQDPYAPTGEGDRYRCADGSTWIGGICHVPERNLTGQASGRIIGNHIHRER